MIKMKTLAVVSLICLLPCAAEATQTETPNLDRSRDAAESYLRSQGVDDAFITDIYLSAYWFVVNQVCGDEYATKEAANSIKNRNLNELTGKISRSTFDESVARMTIDLTSALRTRTYEIGPFCKRHKENRGPTVGKPYNLPAAQGLD
jgi:hypothetical protein